MLKAELVKGKPQWQIIRKYPADPEGLPIPPGSKKAVEGM
jgi:hypothetical protein